MNEMINSSTSLFLLLTIDFKNSHYYNVSIFFFGIVVTTNHVVPENLNGLTHVVKLLFSNVLFALLDLNPIVGILLSMIDLVPLISSNKYVKEIGEKLLQIPRVIIEFYLIHNIIFTNTVDCITILICKVVYFIERKIRINKKDRNDFSSFHSVEHIGLYLLFKDTTGVEFSFLMYFLIFWVFIYLNAIFLSLFNEYLEENVDKRAPDYVKDSIELTSILKQKLEKNKNSKNYHNYIMKPWCSHLKYEFVSWNTIEHICKTILKDVNPNNYDMVVGIATGGCFIGAFVAKTLNKPFAIIHSKLWSGASFKQNCIQSLTHLRGYEQTSRLGDAPDVKDKRVLLTDDTTYTGSTLTTVVKLLKGSAKAKSVSTMVMWKNGKYQPTYYYSNKRIPILWEWGAELD